MLTQPVEEAQKERVYALTVENRWAEPRFVLESAPLTRSNARRMRAVQARALRLQCASGVSDSSSCCWTDVFLHVLRHGALPELPQLEQLVATTDDGVSLLMLLAALGSTEALQWLLHEVDRQFEPLQHFLHAVSSREQTAAHWAATHGREDTLQALIAAGASAKSRDADGRTPLHYAARAGSLPCVRLCLRAGAHANSRDRRGLSPLALAIAAGHQDVARYLLSRGGANVNLADCCECARVQKHESLPLPAALYPLATRRGPHVRSHRLRRCQRAGAGAVPRSWRRARRDRSLRPHVRARCSARELVRAAE